MTSILTNISSQVAIKNLRSVDRSLSTTQANMASGKRIDNSKENASYFGISQEMNADSGLFKSINESLTLTQSSIATSRNGAEQFVELAKEYANRASFFATEHSHQAKVLSEMENIAGRMQTVIDQASFNGDNLLSSQTGTWGGNSWVGTDERQVVSGVKRDNGEFKVTTITINEVPLQQLQQDYLNITAHAISNYSTWNTGDYQNFIQNAELNLEKSISGANSLGLDEKSIERQKNFIAKLADEIDVGVGSMVDADMETEAAKLHAFKIQQELAGHSLSLANKSPQSILSLFS